MRPTIHSGDTGTDVLYLQMALGILGTSVFDEATETAVRDFQDRNGLVQDGVVGAKSWSRIDAHVARQNGAAVTPMFGTPALVGGVPPAPVPTAPLYWPLQNQKPRVVSYKTEAGEWVGSPGRAFWARRDGGRRHIGIDLYADDGDVVIVCEPGRIIRVAPYYRGTDAILVQCDSGVVFGYCELRPKSWLDFGHGSGTTTRVRAGQPLARVGKMRVSSMLHCVTYATGTVKHVQARDGKPVQKELRNPTQYLLTAAKDV